MFGFGIGPGRLASMATHGSHGSPPKKATKNRKDYLVIAGIFAFAAIVSHSGYSLPFVVGAVVFFAAAQKGKSPGQVPQSPIIRDLDAAAKRAKSNLGG